MKRAFVFSLSGHLIVLLVFLIVSWAFSRPKKREYPKTITATFVAKPRTTKYQVEQKKTAEPQKIQQITKPKVNKQAVKSKPKQTTPPSAALAKNNSAGPDSPDLRVDGSEFPYPEYLALIEYRIKSKWQTTRINTDGKLLTTLVYFTIDKSGKLLDVKIKQSSGMRAVDQAARRALANANPLPPLPEGYDKPSLSIDFVFRLRQ